MLDSWHAQPGSLRACYCHVVMLLNLFRLYFIGHLHLIGLRVHPHSLYFGPAERAFEPISQCSLQEALPARHWFCTTFLAIMAVMAPWIPLVLVRFEGGQVEEVADNGW